MFELSFENDPNTNEAKKTAMSNYKQLLHRVDSIIPKVLEVQADLRQLRRDIDQEMKKPAPAPPPPPKKEVQPVIQQPAPQPKKEPVKALAEKTKPAPVALITPPKETKKPPVNMPPTAPKPSRAKRDIERFIGENLINKIGIAVLVLGIGFFVKYAIDQEWIGEAGRVMIGMLSGGLLIGIAHRLRKAYRAFSSVLVGGGLAVFYFTVSVGFHEYQLFPQSVAFISMIVITGFSVLLSIYYDRKELAILALLGGFLTPFLISTGSGNYIVLFTYICILNAGMLVLAYFKKWKIVNIISYAFTIILYGGWLIEKVLRVSDAPMMGALIFGSIFYIMFFYMNIINNIRSKDKFSAFEIGILLSNTALFYAAGMLILQQWDHKAWQGVFTVMMAVVNFVFAYPLYKVRQVDRVLVYLLIGLVLSFISLTAPVQLEGNYITLFWAVEATLLLWLSQRSGISLLKSSSVVIMGLMLISLGMDWQQIYMVPEDDSPLRILLNKGFITSLVAAGSMVFSLQLLRKDEGKVFFSMLKLDEYRTLLTILTGLVLYLAGLLELKFQMESHAWQYGLRKSVFMTYHLFLLIGILYYSLRKKHQILSSIALVFTLGIVLTQILINESAYIPLRADYFEGLSGIAPFLYHYLNTLLIVVSGFMAIKLIQRDIKFRSDTGNLMIGIASIAGVYLASLELDHFVALSFFDLGENLSEILSQSRKVGYPILWGICAFVMMYIGMTKQYRPLRIIALALMLITLLKLFLFDIRGISEAGKIAAFVSLGVLLLVVSFLYQKLKVLVLGETEAADAKIEANTENSKEDNSNS